MAAVHSVHSASHGHAGDGEQDQVCRQKAVTAEICTTYLFLKHEACLVELFPLGIGHGFFENSNVTFML